MTASLQSEQAFLCRRDSSMQPRQKACPQGVSLGSSRDSRQIGQFSFYGTTTEKCYSLPSPSTLARRNPFSAIFSRIFLLSALRLILLSLVMALAFRSLFSSAQSDSFSVSEDACAEERSIFLVKTIFPRMSIII